MEYQSLNIFKEINKIKPKPFKVVRNTGTNMYTGIKLFDREIMNGFPKGSTVMFGISTKLPLYTRIFPFLIIGINFQLQGLNTYVIPPFGLTKDKLTDLVKRWIPAKLRTYKFLSFESKLTLDGLLKWNMTYEDDKNYLLVISMASLEPYLKRKEIIEYINYSLLQVQKAKGLLMFSVDLNSEIYKYVLRSVQYWMDIISYKFTPVMFINAPLIETAYILRPSLDNGYPELETIPVK